MKYYRIENGPVRIGPDHEVILAGDEFERRATRVAVVKEDGRMRTVRPNEGLDFKTGEIVGLTKEPDKQFAANFVAIADGEASKHWDEYDAKLRERAEAKEREMLTREARVLDAVAAKVKPSAVRSASEAATLAGPARSAEVKVGNKAPELKR